MIRVYRRYAKANKVTLYRGDCSKLIKALPDSSVKLTFTSPPYCMGKEYEGTSRIEDFVEAHKKILPDIVRATAPGGSICWQVGYHIRNGRLTPLDFLVHEIMRTFPDITLRNRIMWAYGHGLHCANRFSGRHEVILWYTKSGDYTFNLDAIRVPQKYPGKRHYKGPKKGALSGNPFGKNPSDVWEIPNVKANHVEKTDHPCQFPAALAIRLIRALTNSGDLVLDPFAGSGTTGVAAIHEKRRFAGAEINHKYHALASARCLNALHGNARFREPEITVYTPSPGETVAKMPIEFRTAVNGKTKMKECPERKRSAVA